MPNWDSIFTSIYGLKAKREILFREALTYSLESENVTYLSAVALPAKVLWREDVVGYQRNIWQEQDRASLVIWFRDLTGNATGSDQDVQEWVGRFKGAVQEASREYYSRFQVDGQTLKAREVIPQERPDGKIYALRLVLQAE